MRSRRYAGVGAVPGVVVLLCAAATAAGQSVRYHATDLGDLPGGGDHARPFGLNNRGQVVGMSRATSPYGGVSGIPRPFLWTPDRANGTGGSMIDLGVPEGLVFDSGAATGVNDFGQVVVDAWTANHSQPFLWTPHAPGGTTGVMTPVGPPVEIHHDRVSMAINNYGQVVGVDGSGMLPQHGFLWTPDTPNGSAGNMTDLGDLPGGYDRGSALAINSRGQVAGVADIETLPGDADRGVGARMRPFLWSPSAPNGLTGAMTALDVAVEYPFAGAWGMNDAGQVVGRVSADAGPRAFVWTPDTPGGTTGSLHILGGLSPSNSAEARDINNAGQVVGLAAGVGSAFVWDAEGGMRNLNALLASPLPEHWRLVEAVAVNDAGQILARGLWAPDSSVKPVEHAFLLTPVPEPPPAVLTGVAAAAVLRRPSRRRPAPGTDLIP